MRGDLRAKAHQPPSKKGTILLAKSVLPICSWDWQISEPAFYEAIAPSDGCTDGFASRVREFANSIGNLCGHRRALPILLKIRACLATIGEPISGHPGEQPPAGVGVEPLTVIDGLNQVIVIE